MAKNALTRNQQELLAMLAGELQALLDNSRMNVHESSCVPERLHDAAESLDNFANAAELIGLTGLASAWRCLRDNFIALSHEGANASDEQILLVDSWVMYFLSFLEQLGSGDITACDILPMIRFLAQPAWPQPLNAVQQTQLAESLLFAEVTASEDELHRLPTVATADMLCLVLSEDLNPDLFEGLMIELPMQVVQFTDQLNHFSQSRNAIALASAQRIAHTLKGAANVVGISGLANFMHFSEDLLEEISKHAEPLTAALKKLLLDMSDTLASMLDILTFGNAQGEAIGELELGVMQQVLNAYHTIRAQGFSGFVVEVVVDIPNIYYPNVSMSAERNDHKLITSGADDLNAEVAYSMPTIQESMTAHLRIKEGTAQDLLRLAGESAIATNRLQSQVIDVKQQVQHISSLHNKLTQLTEEFGHLIEVRELFNCRSKNFSNDDLDPLESNSLELDPLELDRYNELHSFFHQLQEFATDTRDAIYQTQGQLRALEDLTFEQQVTNRSSEHHLLEMRMIPAHHFESRFQRCVRQACRSTKKQVRFQLRGGDTMIDSRILHELVDPLMHLLRNAVDHGIESTVEREALGKSNEGVVELQFIVQGQSIVVRVVDDGAGLQRDRIAQKARELSLTPPTGADSDVTDLWLKQIIFAAGFSTRDHVSQTSGRGIGLDIVADRVNELKGRITVDSRPHMGCEFSIRLPLPMITEQGLLIASGKHSLAISSRGVEQLLFLEEAALTNNGEQLRYRFNQQEIDVFHLAQLAQLPGVLAISAKDAHALLVVETLPGQRVGVLVDRVLASREMVVKPLTSFTPQIAGVIGATVLGDGAVAPVLDVQQLVLEKLQSGMNNLDWMANALRISQQVLAVKPMALIVDDSLSTRRSLAQFVGDMGMDVRTAKDGFEAIEILQAQTPHIMLVDMEMPRMNGLELTAHVRAKESTKHIPVIMITSRNTEKHRNLATAAGVDIYLNKPFSEEELLHHIQESMHA